MFYRKFSRQLLGLFILSPILFYIFNSITNSCSYPEPLIDSNLPLLPPEQRKTQIKCDLTQRCCFVANLYVNSGILHGYVGADSEVEQFHEFHAYTGLGWGTPIIEVYVVEDETKELPPPVESLTSTSVKVRLYLHKTLPPSPNVNAYSQPIIFFSVIWENLFRTIYAGVAAWYTLMNYSIFFPDNHRFILIDPAKPQSFMNILQAVTPYEIQWFEQLDDGIYKVAVLGVSRWAIIEEIIPENSLEFRHYLRGNAFKTFSQTLKSKVLSLSNEQMQRKKPLRRPKLTLVRRTETRKILNEDDVISAFLGFPLDVQVVELEKHTTMEQMKIMDETDIFVAMHGAAVSQLVFLREGSYVLELFPYAFQKQVYRNIAKIMGLHYFNWQNNDVHNTVFRWDLVEQNRYTNLEKERVTTLPIDWYNMDSKNYWRNQDTIVNIFEITSVMELMFQHITGFDKMKFLIYAPWEQFNNQLNEFTCACALSVFLDRILVLPHIGYRKSQAMMSHDPEAKSEERKLKLFRVTDYEWSEFHKYLTTNSELPCKTITVQNFLNMNGDRSIGNLRYHHLGNSSSIEQLTSYFTDILKLPYDNIIEDVNVYTHLSKEELLAFHGDDSSQVLALSSLFWYHSFGTRPKYPLSKYYDLHDVPLYNQIQKGFSFSSYLRGLAEKSVQTLPKHYASIHVRRGDYEEKCEELKRYAAFSYLFPSCLQDENAIIKELSKSYQVEIFVATNLKESFGDYQKLAASYRFIFYDDVAPSPSELLSPLDPIESMILEQIICSKAERFVGNLFSTFTRTIMDRRAVDGNRGINMF